MLKEALRRLLWLGPTLIVVTVPIFWALSRAVPPHSLGAAAELPLFFNRDPLDVRGRTLSAVTAAAAGDPRGAAALAELGGAAFPHALPKLDALSPEARARVATALAVVAKRIGIGSPAELDTGDAAALFFSRFWEEHAIDFRPIVVRRAVRRLRERPSVLRRTEVRELDTFALEELVDAMRPLESSADIDGTRPLCEAAAHAAGNDWIIPRGASREEARAVVERWEDFWLDHRGRYASFDGARRLGAMLLETRYGRWGEHLVRRGLGRAGDGVSITASLRERGPTTGALVLAGMLAGYPLALLLALARALRHRGLSGTTTAFALACAGATPLGLVAAANLFLHPGRLGTALALAALSTAGLASRHARAVHEIVSEMPFWQHERAFGVPLIRSALKSLRLVAAVAVAMAVADLPGLLTLAFVLERAFSLHGLGDLTVSAVRDGDLTRLMSLALLGTLLLGAGQIAADLVLSALDPRTLARAARGHGGGR